MTDDPLAPTDSPIRIAVIGLWHLGSVTAACLAEAGFEIIGIDRDPAVVARLATGRAPVHEPGLDELLDAGRASGRLTFSHSFADAAGADVIWMTHDVPVDDEDRGDVSVVLRDGIEAGQYVRGAAIFVSAQVPVGTCEDLLTRLRDAAPMGIAYIPENLQLGKALGRFRSPDVTVVGASNGATADLAVEVVRPFTSQPLVCGVRTAEFTKHAINAFLATSVSYANELGDLAAALGADAHTVAEAMRRDGRIGRSARVIPGLPFMGGTLARDVRALQVLGLQTGRPTRLCDAVLEINQERMAGLAGLLAESIPLREARVALLGLVYTQGTDTLRRAPGLEMARELRSRGATVTAYEPALSMGGRPDEGLTLSASPYEAAADADAIVIMRPDAAAGLDTSRLARVMRGSVVMDPWNVLDRQALAGSHLQHVVPGRPLAERPQEG